MLRTKCDGFDCTSELMSEILVTNNAETWRLSPNRLVVGIEYTDYFSDRSLTTRPDVQPRLPPGMIRGMIRHQMFYDFVGSVKVNQKRPSRCRSSKPSLIMHQDRKILNILGAFVSSCSLCLRGRVFATMLLSCDERHLSARLMRRSPHTCGGAHAKSTFQFNCWLS
jgi:hypothetical protein